MYADRVDIFHAAYGYRVVGTVAHDFKLNFLISFYALFNKYLVHRGKCECVRSEFFKLCLIVGKSAACTAERKGRSQYDRIAYFTCSRLCFLNAVCDLRWYNRLAYGLAHFLKQLSVLCALYALAARAQKLYITFTQHALLFKLHCKIKPCLTADSWDNGIRTLIADNLCDIFQCQRFHINLIRN